MDRYELNYNVLEGSWYVWDTKTWRHVCFGPKSWCEQWIRVHGRE